MPHVADYRPEEHGTPLKDVLVRGATAADLEVTAALEAEREGQDHARCLSRHACRLDDADHRLFVAEVEGHVRGYGWVSYLRPEACGGRGAPDGWYLMGLVVAPDFRRRGLGTRLTEARVDWVLERADEVYYVVSASNCASRRLHDSMGMVEVSRDFSLPGVVFTRSDGILCRMDRVAAAGADVVDLDARRGARGADDGATRAGQS